MPTLLEKYIAKVEEMKKTFPIPLWMGDVPYENQYPYGYNMCLSDIQSLLPEMIKEVREGAVREAVEFIKGKSEKVTNHLWYVADECLEDVPRFFSQEPNK